MYVLYKDVRCPACGGRHNLCMEERATAMTYRPHAFICPDRGRKLPWQPDVFAHRVPARPESSVPLVPCKYLQEVII
jgi:hypothetical protein